MTAEAKRPLRLRDQLIRSFMGVGALRSLSMPISFVVSIILARSLGAEQFGQYAFIMALVPLLALPVVAGIPNLVVREVAKCASGNAWEKYRGVVRFATSWVLGASLVVIAGVWLVIESNVGASTGDRWHLLPIAILAVPLTGLLSVSQAATKGLGFVAQSEVPNQFVRPMTFLVIVAVIASTGVITPRSAIIGQIVAIATGFLVAAWVLRRRRPDAIRQASARYDARHWRRAWLPLSLLAVALTLNGKIAIILLGLLGTDEAVAGFQVALSGAALVTVSLTLVNMVIVPHVVKFRAAGDRENLQLLARQSARGALVFATPVALAFFLLGENMIRIVFGEEFVRDALWPLLIMAAAHLVNVFMGSVGLLLVMSDYEMDTLRSQVVALMLNVIACVILIPVYGAIGAAIGTATGLVIWNVLMSIMVWRRLGIRAAAL